jgi:hypothetical protein
MSGAEGSLAGTRALVRSAAMLLCTLGVLGVWLLASASGASAQLPEFSLLGTPPEGDEGTTITQMNMATGEFSGTSVVDHEDFTVQGVEIGNVSHSTLALDGGGYEAHDINHYEILASGNVGGPGEVEGGGSYFGEVNDPTQTVATTTAPSCTPSGSTYTCSATVTGAGGTPTGNLTFSAPEGTFVGESACQMSAGTCSVAYQPPTGGSVPVVSAVYSGDATFRVSQGTTKEQEEVVAKAKEAKEAKEKKEKESSGKRKPAVAVTCTINIDGSGPSTCTAQVGDATGGNPVEVPTGTVRFATTLGSFLGSDTCTLTKGALSGNTSACTVQYAPPPGKSIIGTELPITAAYSGDTSFSSGEGQFKLAQKGIQAEELEDDRINREACEADENITAEVNEKKYEVTVPYTAPGDGTVDATLDSAGGDLGAVFSRTAPLPQALVGSDDDAGGGPSSSISKECEAKVTLALTGAKQSSRDAPDALSAKRQKSKSKTAHIVIARVSIKVKHAGKLKLHIRLNEQGRQLVALMKRKHRHARIELKLRFKP